MQPGAGDSTRTQEVGRVRIRLARRPPAAEACPRHRLPLQPQPSQRRYQPRPPRTLAYLCCAPTLPGRHPGAGRRVGRRDRCARATQPRPPDRRTDSNGRAARDPRTRTRARSRTDLRMAERSGYSHRCGATVTSRAASTQRAPKRMDTPGSSQPLTPRTNAAQSVVQPEPMIRSRGAKGFRRGAVQF